MTKTNSAPEEVREEEERLLIDGDVARLWNWYRTTLPCYWSSPLSVLRRLCNHGHLQAMKWAVSYFHLKAGDLSGDRGVLLDATGKQANIAVLQWLCEWLEVNEKKAGSLLYRACACNRLGHAKWLTAQFGITRESLLATDQDVWHAACASANLELMQWVVETFGLPPDNMRSGGGGMALQHVCSGGGLDVVKWADGLFKYDKAEACTALVRACRAGDANVVRWLIEEFDITARDMGAHCVDCVTEAIAANSTEIVDVLATRFGIMHECSREILWQAFTCGNLDLVQHIIYTYGYPAGNVLGTFLHALDHLLDGRCLAVAQWLYTRYGLSSLDIRYDNNKFWRAACRSCDVDTVRWFAQTFRFTVSDVCADKCQALRHACGRNRVEFAHFLCDYFLLTVDDIREYATSIMQGARALGHTRIVRLFVDRFGLREPLVYLNNEQTEEQMLIDGDQALIKAAYRFEPPTCMRTAFVLLCRHGRADIACWLADEYAVNKEDALPGFVAACKGGQYDSVLRLFVHYRFTDDDVRANNNAVLRKACAGGNLDIITWLFAHYKFTPAEVREVKYKMLEQACKHGHSRVVAWMIDNGYFARRPARSSLVRAACCAYEHGQNHTARFMVDKFGLRRQDFDALSGVHSLFQKVCTAGYLHTAQCLVDDLEMTPEEVRRFHVTTLDSVCEGGDVDIAQWLVEFAKYTRQNARAGLAGACRGGHTDLALWFIEHYSYTSVDICYRIYAATVDTVFSRACASGNLSLVRLLAERFDITLENRQGVWVTPLLEACAHGGPEVARFLLERRSFTADEIRADDNAILRITCARGQLEVAQLLVERFGLTADDIRAENNAALRMACSGGHAKVVRWLVGRFGLTVDDVRAMDNEALCMASRSGYINIVRWLVTRFGLTADDARAWDNFAVRRAFGFGHVAVGKWLVERFGLTRDDVMGADQFALKTARQLRRDEAVRWLENFASSDA